MKYKNILFLGSMKCNASCSYCFMGNDSNPFSNCTINKQVLGKFLHRISEYLDTNENGIILTLHGGEPTLMDKEVFSEFEKAYLKVDRSRLHFHIQSNLLYLPDYIIDFIKNCDVKVSTSIDGDYYINSKSRGYTKKQYSKWLQNVKKIKSLNANVGVVCVLNTYNISHSAKILECFAKLGISPRFNICYDIDDQPISFKRYFSVLKELSKIRFQYKDISVQPIDSHIYKILSDNKVDIFCNDLDKCADYYIAVDNLGATWSCGRYHNDNRGYVGDIFKNTIEELYQINCKIFSQKKIKTKCESCDLYPICGRACMHQQEYLITEENDYCSSFKEYAEELINLTYEQAYN